MPNQPYYKMVTDPNGKRVPKWEPREIRCPKCWKEFITRDPTQVYCSASCGKKDRGKKRIRIP